MFLGLYDLFTDIELGRKVHLRFLPDRVHYSFYIHSTIGY
jgi:hypothetical protein